MSYDAENLAALEGEARAAAFWLGQALKPVQHRLTLELDAFDLLTASTDEARRHQELRVLLQAMQSYCETAGALNQQLSANLTTAEETAHREAARAAMFLQQIRLVHADLRTEQELSLQQLATFQNLLRRAA
jgi:hypothetical protein